MSGAIMVATCTLGKVRMDWAMAFKGAVAPQGRTQHVTSVEGFPTAHARNVACSIAQERGFEFLFFWDDDVVPRDKQAFMRIITDMTIQTGVTAISAVYPRRAETPEPIVIVDKDSGTSWAWQDGMLHKTYVAGTGFMCLRVADFPKLELPNYTSEDGREFRMYFNSQEDPFPVTDDFWLGDRLEESGLTWMVDGGVVCDQIDIEGKVYRVEDAKVEVAVG